MKYGFIEAVRRIVQMLFGNELFEFPVLNSIKIFMYRAVFNIGKKPVIGYGMRFFRSHKMKDGTVKVGNRVLLAKQVMIDYSGTVIIEDDVWISERVQIHSHLHKLDENRLAHRIENIVPTAITLKKGCWIGAGSTILPNVNYIGENAVVGAGSVVTKNVSDNSIVGGNPAKLIRML